MINIDLKCEEVVQINDQTRFDLTKTFITSDEGTLTSIKIKPDSVNFPSLQFTITTNKYLDYAYDEDGEKEIEIEVITSETTKTITKTISALSVEDDKLFSSDYDLVKHENGIFRYLREGRSSFLDKHREAQAEILRQLDRERITKTDGTRLTKSEIADVEDVKDWSKYLVLYYILNAQKSEVGDVFDDKSKDYLQRSIQSRASALLRLDLNQDGAAENYDILSTRIFRR
jgi:hypothetical protein